MSVPKPAARGSFKGAQDRYSKGVLLLGGSGDLVTGYFKDL